jgi:hypothetical protein
MARGSLFETLNAFTKCVEIRRLCGGAHVFCTTLG